MKPYIKLRKMCGKKAFSNSREKARWDEDKEYVRSSRCPNNLPDAWDDTKFLPRYKGWKHRTKVHRQFLRDDNLGEEYE